METWKMLFFRAVCFLGQEFFARFSPTENLQVLCLHFGELSMASAIGACPVERRWLPVVSVLCIGKSPGICRAQNVL